jgi:hypothetical protein
MPEVLHYASPNTPRTRDDRFYFQAFAITHIALGTFGALSSVLVYFATDAEAVIVIFLGSILVLLSGVCMHLRRLRFFSMIVAGILLFPLGVLFGIYTLRLLTRESVVALYQLNTRRY